MTPEEFEILPALTACPGKPACDHDSLCGDHRDVFRWMQKVEAVWRDTIIAAREARDHADLQVGEWRLLAGSLLQRVHDLGLHEKSIQFCDEPTCKAVVVRLAGAAKPKPDPFICVHGNIHQRGFGTCAKCIENGEARMQNLYGNCQTCGAPLPPPSSAAHCCTFQAYVPSPANATAQGQTMLQCQNCKVFYPMDLSKAHVCGLGRLS